MDNKKTFLIHVIDEASQHIRSENGEYVIRRGKSKRGEDADVIRGDAVYLVEAESHFDAIVIVANMIRVKGPDGQLHSISEEFSKTKTELEIQEVNLENQGFFRLKKDDLLYVHNMTTHYHQLYCQIPYEDSATNDEWVELHTVHFHVVPQEKIILIKDE